MNIKNTIAQAEKEERKFDESTLVYLWEKKSYKEMRAYFLDCFERLVTTPNPSYSQAEVDRLINVRTKDLLQSVIDNLGSNPNEDGSQSPNIQHWIEQKQIQLRNIITNLPPRDNINK